MQCGPICECCLQPDDARGASGVWIEGMPYVTGFEAGKEVSATIIDDKGIVLRVAVGVSELTRSSAAWKSSKHKQFLAHRSALQRNRHTRARADRRALIPTADPTIESKISAASC